MEPKEIIELVICCIIGLFIIISVGNNLFKEEKIRLSILDFIILILILGIIIINRITLNSIARILTTYITTFVAYKILYKCNTNKLLIGSLYSVGIVIASEGLTALLFLIPVINVISNYEIIGNIIVLITATVVSKRINININSISNKIKVNYSFYIIGIVIFILCMITIVVFRLKTKNYIIDYEIFTNIILIILLFIVGIVIENDRKISDKLQEKYTDLAKYTKQSENLIDIYRIERHENRNQLIIIKNMIEQNNPKTIEYIDNLLNIKSKQINNGFICDLQYLNIPGLKGFVNYKLQEMKDLGINIELTISKDVLNFKYNKFSIKEEDELYNLIGIYIDNAKEASLDSKEKIVAINIYKDKKKMVIEIANTYDESVEIYNNNGNIISTKGYGHGYGLKIANSIIDKSKVYSVKTEVRNGFFSQKLMITEQKKRDK